MGTSEVSQFRTELAEQAVSGQSELEEQFGVCGAVEVDPIGQTLSQRFGLVRPICTADDLKGVGFRDNPSGHLCPSLSGPGRRMTAFG
jgi:hypothetical protein